MLSLIKFCPHLLGGALLLLTSMSNCNPPPAPGLDSRHGCRHDCRGA
jgi:hypothetical protein